MKKLICLLAACLLLMPAAAADMSEYRCGDAGLTLSLPQGDEWVILTEDVQEGDPAVDFFDTDVETLRTSMEQSGIRFEAITQDRMCEITIVATRDRTTRRTFNYAAADRDELQAQAQAYVDKDYSSDSPGLDYTAWELIPSGDLLYLRFDGEVSVETSNTRFVQYVTIYNGWMISLSLLSFNGQMPEEYEQLAADIAHSVRFDEALTKLQDPQRYIDIAVGVGVGALAILLVLRLRKKQRRLNGESPSGQDPALPPRGDSPDAQP